MFNEQVIHGFKYCSSSNKLALSVRFKTSQNGRRLIQIGLYTFCRKRTTAYGKTQWVCSTHNNRRCKASLTTIEDEIVRVRNEHNH